MRPLTTKEKRTVRIGAVLIAVYLVIVIVFFRPGFLSFFDKGRHDYVQLVADAKLLKLKLEPYESKTNKVQKLMDEFHLDPAKLSKATVVAEASAAIQKAAQSGGLQLGSVRETPARASNKELAQIQLDGTGPVPAMLAFLSRLDSIGYPLIVDAVQFTADNSRPGNVKMTLTIIILDFEQWKSGGRPNA